jgi:hypothetical protein
MLSRNLTKHPIYLVGQQYGVPQVFIITFYENVFQNAEIFPTKVSLSPEQSTLVVTIQKYWGQLDLKKTLVNIGQMSFSFFRFVPPKNVFAPAEENPYNDCYCMNDEGCDVPRGLFNLSACQFGSPVLLSWPHFFQVYL